MNYECEFRDFLMENLKIKYRINDDINLLFYLFARYQCLSNKKEIDPHKFMQFVIRQLYIIEDTDSVSFQGNDFTYYFAAENSLRNIFDEWEFWLFTSPSFDLNGNRRNMHQEIKTVMETIKENANRKILKYKNSKYRKEILRYFKIQELNQMLKVEIQDVPNLPGVPQLDIRLSDEECLERYLHAEQFNTTNTKIITEASLRDYLFSNLNLIEDGLTPIGKEVPTDEGRIDILAKDKNGHYVIIELKTEIDKRLIWQCLYYPEVLPHEFPVTSSIRVITVCPEYPEYLLTVLKRLPLVELYQYEIHSTNSRIEDIQISKL